MSISQMRKKNKTEWLTLLFGNAEKIAARILCAFRGSGRQFFTLDIVSYFPPWSNCFSAKVCLKKWMIMTPFACHWHFDCAAENLLCALLIFGSCAETKVFVIVKKNASLWRGCAHKKPAPCQMTWCRAFLRWEKPLVRALLHLLRSRFLYWRPAEIAPRGWGHFLDLFDVVPKFLRLNINGKSGAKNIFLYNSNGECIISKYKITQQLRVRGRLDPPTSDFPHPWCPISQGGR